MRIQFVTSLIFFMIFSAILGAQPANDDCTNAILIDNLDAWCSEVGAFRNQNASTSAQSRPGCFANQTNRDVWFSFVAKATELSVSVIGNTDIRAGGTLRQPQFALYTGSCDNLQEVECISDGGNRDFVQIFGEQLIVGQTYFIRVSARNGNTGTFQLCVNNFDIVPEASGDCSTAVILCDKEPFSVPFLSGSGNDRNEIGNVDCSGPTCPLAESGSTWYKWTCKDPGTLTFTITPLNPVDDIDFVVYELPNGINNCSNKADIRCEAAGENQNTPLSEWLRCTGATGLREGDPDTSEPCGCPTGNNNFVAAIDMVAGRSYALLINNFSQSGSGFSIDFGGTGTFVGPTADFTASTDTICVGESITFTDASTFIGGIRGWQWNFGAGASLATSNSRGPHTVSYNTPGQKSVLLTIEAEGGCLVTKILNIVVGSNQFDITANITNSNCPNTFNGAIDISANNPNPPLSFAWSNGQNTEDISGLFPGDYTVSITNALGCSNTETFTVQSPPPFEFDTLIVMPNCGGGINGSLTLQVTGATPPYQYNWQGAGFSDVNFLNNIPEGNYGVTVRDANGCEVSLLIPVTELRLRIDTSITRPTCNGFADGSIQIAVTNGQAPYQYSWNGGNLGTGTSIANLTAGVYRLDILDANLCRGEFDLTLEDHPPVTVDFDVMDISCNGQLDGSITAMPLGGVGNYTFRWDKGQTTPTISNLPAGDFFITVTDGNGCEGMDTATVIEPEVVRLTIGNVANALCFGTPTGSVSLVGSGGTLPYAYRLNGEDFQLDSTFINLPAGTYNFTIRDDGGCTATASATITQPAQLTVDAGENQTIDLGDATTITAIANATNLVFQWSPPDSLSCLDCPSPEVNPSKTTPYTVTVEDPNGCIATDEVTIIVTKNRKLFIPTAFSPNGDGFNDFFTLFGGKGASQIKSLRIFSRWGELIFERKDLPLGQEAAGWDGTFKGKPLSPGVFVFMAEVEFIDQEVVLFEGDVTIIK